MYIDRSIQTACEGEHPVTITLSQGETFTGFILTYTDDFIRMFDQTNQINRTVDVMNVSRWQFDYGKTRVA